MTPLSASLGTLTVATPQQYEHLTLVPLLDATTWEPFYLTFEEALNRGVARITEVSDGGHVPELRFTNTGDRPVLLFDGEELVGAKQNRVLNLTILAPAHSELVIPVSCVEQGRWRATSGAFNASPHWHFQSGRRDRVEAVSASLASGGGAHSDQGKVWEKIYKTASRLCVNSPTHAMADVFDQLGPRLKEYNNAFTTVPGERGALFAMAGRVVGLEVIFSQATFAHILPKLVQSYALDAIQCEDAMPAAMEPGAAPAFLQQVVQAKENRFPGIGLGESIRLSSPAIVGVGLAADAKVLHLAAFRKEQGNGTSPFSQRTRFMRASDRFHV